jgi:hypothetical protein
LLAPLRGGDPDAAWLAAGAGAAIPGARHALPLKHRLVGEVGLVRNEHLRDRGNV